MMKRKFVSILLVIVMCVSMVMTAFAEEIDVATKEGGENEKVEVTIVITGNADGGKTTEIATGEEGDVTDSNLTVNYESTETVDAEGEVISGESSYDVVNEDSTYRAEGGDKTEKRTEEDTGDEKGQIVVLVPLTPGATTSGTGEKTETTGDADKTDGEWDTTTTNTVERTVTVTTSEWKTTVNESENAETDLKGYVPVYDVIDGVKEDKAGMFDSQYMENVDAFGDPSAWDVPEGADVRLVSKGEKPHYFMPFVKVVYEKNENGDTVIKELRTDSGTLVTNRETGEPLKEILPAAWNAPCSGYRIDGSYIFMDENGNKFMAYCCDNGVPQNYGDWYHIENLEDAGYYVSKDSEEHIRAIATEGYWGTSDIPVVDEDGNPVLREDGENTYQPGSLESVKQKMKDAIMNGEISGTFQMVKLNGAGKALQDENGKIVTEEVNMLDLIDGLTEGEALTAMQAAIWSYSNGSGEVLRGDDGKIIIGGNYIGNHNLSSVPEKLDEEGGARLDFMYNWLMGLEGQEPTTTVINKENYVDTATLAVGDKVGSKTTTDENGVEVVKDVYDTALKFTLKFVPNQKNDDLLVTLSYTDADGNPQTVTRRLAGEDSEGRSALLIEPDANGVYTLSGLKLSENETFDFELKVEGKQYLEDNVYLFQAINGKEAGQTMVGMASGDKSVDASIGFSVSFDVDETDYVTETREWRREWTRSIPDPSDPPVDPQDPPQNPPVEELPNPEVPLEELPEEEVPLGELTEIMEEDVPLANVPMTGDSSRIFIGMVILSAFGLAGLALTGSKKKSI